MSKSQILLSRKFRLLCFIKQSNKYNVTVNSNILSPILRPMVG